MDALTDDPGASSLAVMNSLWGRDMAALTELSGRSGISVDIRARIKPVAAVFTRHLWRNRRDSAIAAVADRTFVLPDADYVARHPARPLAAYNSFLDVVEASVASLSQKGSLEVALVEALAANSHLSSPVILAPDLTVPALRAFYGPGNPRLLTSADYRLLRKYQGFFGFFVGADSLTTLGSHVGLVAKLVAQDVSSDDKRELRGLETIYNLTV